MTLQEQVYLQAEVIIGPLEQEEQPALEIVCQAAVTTLTARLREGLTPEDCKADFVAAASLYAIAALAGIRKSDQLTHVTVGDVTLRRPDSDVASKCLFNQAELIIAPYLRQRFSFRGV